MTKRMLNKGKFIWKTGKDRDSIVASIKHKIDSGFFLSKEVLTEITARLEPDFSSVFVDD